MSESMREEFEAWAIKQAEIMRYSFPPSSVELNGLGDYAIVWVQGAWLGWQSSRAALCVELPVVTDYIDLHRQGMNAKVYNEALTEAIHAAGVKTK